MIKTCKYKGRSWNCREIKIGASNFNFRIRRRVTMTSWVARAHWLHEIHWSRIHCLAIVSQMGSMHSPGSTWFIWAMLRSTSRCPQSKKIWIRWTPKATLILTRTESSPQFQSKNRIWFQSCASSYLSKRKKIGSKTSKFRMIIGPTRSRSSSSEQIKCAWPTSNIAGMPIESDGDNCWIALFFPRRHAATSRIHKATNTSLQ